VALEGEPAAVTPGAPGVRDEGVALDPQRLLGLEELGRGVRVVDDHPGAGVHAVAVGAASPRADQELEVDEGTALAVVAAEAHPGVG
jgi:hypothetical protein